MKNLSLTLILTAMALFVNIPLMADEWPNFLGPNKNNISSEIGINKNWNTKPPKTLWITDLGDSAYAGPIAADGKVFIIDRKDNTTETVRAIDLNTGKNIWSYSYSDKGKKDQGFGRTTPAYDNGKLYTISRNGLLNCLDAKTGKKIWSMDLVSKFKGELPKWLYSISPVIDGERLIVCPPGKKNVAVLNKNTGKLIWSGGNDDKIGYAAPVIATIDNKKQYVIFTGFNLIGVDAENGKVLWSCPWKTAWDVNAATPIFIDKNTIFITTDYQTGCGLVKVEGSKAELVWQNKNLLSHFSTPILYNGYIYGNSNKDHLKCIDPKTGNIIWEQTGFEKGGLIIVDGVIIAIDGDKGGVYMVEAGTTYKQLGKISPLEEGRNWVAPIISDKKLIIRNNDKMACIDLTP